MKWQIILLIAIFSVSNACHNKSQSKKSGDQNDSALLDSYNLDSLKLQGPAFSFDGKLELSREVWKNHLDEMSYYVLRTDGTERAFTGAYWDHKEDGVYSCAGCGLVLFSSEHKYKSGTGWPSYYKPYDDKNVGKDIDKMFGMTRTEVHCARCGGHLGHLFDDGPKPTGLRYCINSASLEFISGDDLKPSRE